MTQRGGGAPEQHTNEDSDRVRWYLESLVRGCFRI